jgi:hypothetical protein
MFIVATAVTEYTVFIPQFLPQKDAAIFGVVRLDKSKKVHNQKQLKCGCNIGKKPLSAKAYGRLEPNPSRNYTLINVYLILYCRYKTLIPHSFLTSNPFVPYRASEFRSGNNHPFHTLQNSHSPNERQQTSNGKTITYVHFRLFLASEP